ncbi:hypothetical protein [Streptomyces bikiniensis]|uniref:hypothetical protein n=1 Tax=Streptomyces bikiniensis TaxID=1896 RepID=UPI00131A4FF6|nr:hypothetical protein [Streptomyces bikiniensis]
MSAPAPGSAAGTVPAPVPAPVSPPLPADPPVTITTPVPVAAPVPLSAQAPVSAALPAPVPAHPPIYQDVLSLWASQGRTLPGHRDQEWTRLAAGPVWADRTVRVSGTLVRPGDGR